MPAALRDLDYDAYRDIRFRPEKALWRAEKLPFELMFFHQGRAVPEPVRINVDRAVAASTPCPSTRPCSTTARTSSTRRRCAASASTAFASTTRSTSRATRTRCVVFQGASYFRALGKGQVVRPVGARPGGRHGCGAERRGVPALRRVLDRAAARQRDLADDLRRCSTRGASPAPTASCSRPAPRPTMQVTARLFLREKIAKLGIAPLTSMFAFGENQPGRDDYRPEVHDSDGLSIELGRRRMDLAAAGQSAPPARHLVRADRSARLRPDAARPRAGQLRGSGGALRAAAERLDRARRQLGRRPRRAGADPDARRDQRQHRRLLGAAAPPAPGKPLDFAYRMHWQTAGTLPAGKGWVVQTRRGRGFAKQGRRRHQVRRRLRRADPARARRRSPTSSRSSGSMPTPKSWNATCSATRSAARGA